MKTNRRNLHSSNGRDAVLDLPWHSQARMMLQVSKRRMNLWVGEPGTGKTTFARHVAIEYTGSEPEQLQGTPTREPEHIWGYKDFDGDRLNFVDGPLPAALKAGRWLVIEDFSLIPVEIRSDLLPLRDQATIVNPFTKETLEIPESFRCICTSNSEVLTCRKNTGISQVLYDGMLILEVPEVNESLVRRFLWQHFPEASGERIDRVLELWNEYRDFTAKGANGKAHLSYRAASDLLDLLEKGMDERPAVQIALVNKFMAGDADLFSTAKLKNSLQEPDSDKAPSQS